MIPKVTGYSGFRTYGQLPYPTKKQGKQLQDKNKVWEDTRRQLDVKNTLDNFNNAKSNYKASYLENTLPQNYHVKHVIKGAHGTLNFPGTIKPYDAQQIKKASNVITSRPNIDQSNPIQLAKRSLLKTGTQHWKTNYQAAVNNPNANNANMSATMGANWGVQSRGNSIQGNNQNQSGTSWKTQSLDKDKLREAEGRANSYKNRPFINHGKLGVTQYKFNFGQSIGSSPMDLMSGLSYKQPRRDNPLKHGTNQLWTQIPNYQGFKPSALPFSEIEKKIEERPHVDRGNQKLLLSQNYHVDTPGYCGYKPKFQTNKSKLRQTCFGGN